MAKKMNHAEYMKKMKTNTHAELKYIVKDAQEALKANPEGENSS